MLRRPLLPLLVTAPMGPTAALATLAAGVSLCGFLLVTSTPPGVPVWLPYLLMPLGLTLSARGLIGLLPRSIVRGLYVDRRRYARALLDESRRLDVARLPPLDLMLEGPVAGAVDSTRLRGRVVLEGGHGSGKSYLAIKVAAERLESGQRGLYIRLSGWTTTLRELIGRTLDAAAGQPLDASAFEAYFSGSSFVILDSVDEVPYADRPLIGEQITQFSAAHPGLEVVVTARPSTLPASLMDWKRVRLALLTRQQIEAVLGEPMHRLALPPPIAALASNPLMLGLLRTQIGAGETPKNEASLLDAYVEQLLIRQASRDASVDQEAGWRIAEETAWTWLAVGRVALSLSEVRSVAARVAVGLRETGLLMTDAPAVERWIKECGLVTVVRDEALPVHRALLDHLAGRALPRHQADAEMGSPEFREATARYVARQSSVDGTLLQQLDRGAADLEFLARCSRLVDKRIEWPFEPEDFAVRYLGQLRLLADGPLAGLGVIPSAVRVQIDRDLTFVSQEGQPVAADEVVVVPSPPRAYITVARGTPIPVASFRMGSIRGNEIAVRVPQLAAYESARFELLHRVDKALLPNEGPDITYERLCSYATRLWDTVSIFGTAGAPGLSRLAPPRLTTLGLVEQVLDWLSTIARRQVHRAELQTTLICSVPPSRTLVTFEAEPAIDDPYDPRQGRNGLCIHGAPLLLLAERAEVLGVADLPLHALGLLPASPSDPVLLLPPHPLGFDRDQVALFVTRHELAEMRAIRHLVRSNFAGVADRLPSYATMPWRVSLLLQPDRGGWSDGWSVQGRVERRAEREELVLVDSLDGDWTFSRSDMSYRSPLEHSYRQVHRELKDLLGGERALGAEGL